MKHFWKGFASQAIIKLASVELSAWGINHKGERDNIGNAYKSGVFHIHEDAPRDHYLQSDEHYFSPKTHAQMAEYAEKFKKSIDDFGRLEHKGDLHAFADSLHKASKNKRYKYFELGLG